jgi:hypothetical protein
MDYNLIKDNPVDIDVILQQLHRQIVKENIRDYIVILGDSVAYSGPGAANQSIGYYMQQMSGHKQHAIFNLAMPAMQTGDIYTMLLKMDQYHISSDKVIINLVYSGFARRESGPAIVFWLKNSLQQLDPASFEKMLPFMFGFQPVTAPTDKLKQYITENAALYRYRDFIKKGFKNAYNIGSPAYPANEPLGDNRPWYEKEGLSTLLHTPEYEKGFAPEAFNMSLDNPQIFFLEKIIDHQKNKKTLFFMAPVNDKLFADQVHAKGYVANRARVKAYFGDKPVLYIDLQGLIDNKLFTDHVHLTAAGYQQMAQTIWNQYQKGAEH